jgi:hypothetical protein
MSVSSKCAAVFGALALLGIGTVTSPAGAAQETGWRIASVSPDYAGGDGFSDIAATGSNDAWAVGTAPCCEPDGRKISHWDGATWRSVVLPAAPQGALYPRLSTVGASSPENVWVFGDGADGPAFGHHWDGTTWRTTTFSPGVRIKETVVIGPGNAWVTGLEQTETGEKPITEHYDGDQWTRIPLPGTVQNVGAISAVSANDLWVIGDAEGGVPVTMHWNGSAWRTIDLPKPSLDKGVHVIAGDVLAVGPDDAWASGILADMGLRPGPVLWHWNGRRWSQVTVDAPQDSLAELAPDGSRGLWMVSAGVRPTADLLHYSHGRLTREPAPVEPGTTAGVDELVLIPGTRSLWGAGSLARDDGYSAAAVYRYDPAS